MDGLNVMLKNGPWFIRNHPLILKKWNPDVNLLKEDVENVPVWVKLHGIPVTAFSEDGRSNYARTMIELKVDAELKDTMVVAMPTLFGEGFYTCTVRVKYEWKPPRCAYCKVFGHTQEDCRKNLGLGVAKSMKKTSQAPKGFLVGSKMGFKPAKEYRHVSKKPTTNASRNKKNDVEPTNKYLNEAVMKVETKNGSRHATFTRYSCSDGGPNGDCQGGLWWGRDSKAKRGRMVAAGVGQRWQGVVAGGPSWSVKLGRRDSTTASLVLANTGLPSFKAPLDSLISTFNDNGLSPRDMVALSDVGNVLVYVKLYGIPVTVFSEDGLSDIATKIGTPLMLDSYNSDMCLQSWGRSSYARTMIELKADVKLKDTIVVVMPKLTREGFYTCLGVAKNMKKTNQAPKGFLVGSKMGFKPTKEYRPVSKKPTTNASGNKKNDVEPTNKVSNSSPIDVLNFVENDMDYVPMGGLQIRLVKNPTLVDLHSRM
uniref:Plant heme peroxidase family profile domain-containing protein n=1 Tax=Tanacetum cinerariifolium TaxID=118510 RepID=A0A6L2MMM0_TANCI|nr:hypothetical protein [Tanacetum cinerariifolium]